MNNINHTRDVMYAKNHSAVIHDVPIPDIDESDEIFPLIFERCRRFTMTSKPVMYSLYQACKYVGLRGLPGAFVECGVWRGGSSLLAALTFRQFDPPGYRRKIWLYDTFDGMTPPTEHDVDLNGGSAKNYIDQYGDDGRWCYSDLDEVKQIFSQENFSEDEVSFIKGDVQITLGSSLPSEISVLRLDTDWYESTRIELDKLYPLLTEGGILIVDDYGHWKGAKRAVDEYFRSNPPILLNRIDYAVRVGVKL
nr:TylF/MycF/NovP-related O-methyltransferase [Nitrosomonas nitrosa]